MTTNKTATKKAAVKATKKAAAAMVESNLEAIKPEARAEVIAKLDAIIPGLGKAAIMTPPAVETRFVATSPNKSGKCASCKRATKQFYHYADGNTKLCLPCIEEGLKATTPAPVGEAAVAEVAQPAAAPAAKPQKATKAKGAKKDAVAKPAAEKSDALNITLNKRGRLYFGTSAAARIEGMKFFTITVEGKTLRVVATKAKGDGVPMKFSHEHPVVRVTKQLREMGWNGEGSVITATPVGDAGFVLAIKGVK